LRRQQRCAATGVAPFALCKVAAGELDAYAVEFGKSWDFAAGVLLVREAGGTVTTWADHHYYPEHDTQILATNGLLHDTVVDLLKPYRRA
jgi:myo-inositol-1(or 4)-monophosphatase